MAEVAATERSKKRPVYRVTTWHGWEMISSSHDPHIIIKVHHMDSTLEEVNSRPEGRRNDNI